MPTPTDWNGLYQAHITPLYRFVSRRVGGDRSLAEDVTQETWLRAIDSWRRKGPPRDVDAWLASVAANLLRNHFRRRKPAPWNEVDSRELATETTEQHELERAAHLQWGLARLRNAQARLIEAHHLDGLSLAVLAQEAGLSERAIEGRLHRARAALRALLGNDLLTSSQPPAANAS